MIKYRNSFTENPKEEAFYESTFQKHPQGHRPDTGGGTGHCRLLKLAVCPGGHHPADRGRHPHGLGRADAETTITDALPTEAEAASGASKNYGEAQLVSVANDSGTRFFEQARLKREKAHDEAMDTLQKSLKSSSLTAEEKKEYTAQMAAGLEDLNAENEIETLVRAKGFADCLCFLQAGRADLTVMTAGEPLTAAQVAQIRDVVMNKSSVTAQNITVVEVK